MKNRYIILGLTILLALFFIVAGIEKLRESFHILANYEAIGLSITFMKVFGVLEILGAVGLLFKKTASYSVMWLALLTTFTLLSSASAQLWDAVIVAVIALALIFTYLKFKKKSL